MKALLKWLAGIASGVIAGLILYAVTTGGGNGNDEPPRPDQNPCDPLPDYLSEIKLMPPSWPSGKAPLILEFEAVGPDAQGKISEYRWDYEGDVKTGPRVKFALQSGANIISLRVTDVNGCTVHRQRRIVLR